MDGDQRKRGTLLYVQHIHIFRSSLNVIFQGQCNLEKFLFSNNIYIKLLQLFLNHIYFIGNVNQIYAIVMILFNIRNEKL